MKNLNKILSEIRRYPSAIIGGTFIILLIAAAIWVVITLPYNTAIDLWRGGEAVWYRYPKNAAPEWMNFFTKDKQPVSFYIDNTKPEQYSKVVTPGINGSTDIKLTYTFDYQYDGFPQELSLYFKTNYTSKQPYVNVYWITPGGGKIQVTNMGLGPAQTLRFSQVPALVSQMGNVPPSQGLFTYDDPNKPVKGKYQVVVEGITFEPKSDINAEFVLYGKVYGIAGTDYMRRDLTVALRWGIPVALIFGLAASFGTSILTMLIAGFGAWYGGWLDELIQRITEINLVLPFLSILIMIGTFYSRSIWVILGATVALSIFTGGIKTYRAIFMQVRESMYIEAARAYGASDMRIVFNYLIPRMIPLLIPGLVAGVPSYVFLESTLAVLGLGDPVLPTWGKIIDDAFNFGALYKGLYYWILEPAVLLMITGLAFALLGFALDRIFNPRLRGM